MTDVRSICNAILFGGAMACCATIASAQPSLFAPTTVAPPVAAPVETAAILSQNQIQQLVAPIALYPDPLLAEVLPASTYPVDVAAAAQWLSANPNPPQPAIDSQPWDPTVKALVHYPTVLERMGADPAWSGALGEAYLNQPGEVTAAVQTLRHEAQSASFLASSPQQTITTSNGSIDIEPADPDVVYVPSYNPVYANAGWTWGIGLNYGLGYPLGPWLNTNFNWNGGFVTTGVDWNQGWRGRWHQKHPNIAVTQPELVGKTAVPQRWTHDKSRPAPVLRAAARPIAPASGHEPVSGVRTAEPARPSGGTFGPVNTAAQVERDSARGQQSRAPAQTRPPEQARPVQQAPVQRSEPQRSASPPPAARPAAPAHTVQQQSARGHASRGKK